MNQFAPILPELILTVGGIVLMMVAAFGGRRSGGLTAWAAVALLIVATFALTGAPSNAPKNHFASPRKRTIAAE